jgi:hypothetical protein
MGKYRTLSERNQYYLPKHSYLACIHYALQYRDWQATLSADRDTRGAIRYDKEKVKTSNDYDSTSETAMKMTEIKEKCTIIDECISAACDGSNLDKWLRLGVCYGFAFFQLEQDHIPCGKDMYYRIRQRFYYELSKRI